ncbi:hypothetical protein Pmani_002024 [Petrolisthes manimaculis]|uniref:Uncharacterized protein n=1 Tax=Petrolisthes manimaculis TaxID=1843537 RepID=A0AAE1QL54_9EUCA|nr:hypothetical protein Pmani_002024 [Petrolisthes manimaculis]
MTTTEVSQKTRVLVQPQSRYKQYHPKGTESYYYAQYRDSMLDWGDNVFLYYLQKQNHQSTPMTSLSGNGEKHIGPFVTGEEDYSSQGQPIYERDVGVWWWDTSLPLNLATISECQQLYQRGLTSHTLYSNNLLHCADPVHAGYITLRDQTIMLLNLICNSLMDSPHTACCY